MEDYPLKPTDADLDDESVWAQEPPDPEELLSLGRDAE